MGANNAIIIHPILKSSSNIEDGKLEEAIKLGKSVGLKIINAVTVQLNHINPRSYIGTGKIEELIGQVEDIDLVIINADISPTQQRNLETTLECKVIDRTALIIEIFGERARTSEGKLQVELAALEYQKSRVVKSWTHLERQRGGAGFMGGPGEKQIESDRRQINVKIDSIKKQLHKVVRTRELHRKSRKKIPYEIVALVGYTNAGKSTLFNLLTRADVMAEDKLFATLDPTMRLIKLPSGKKIILSDTVGFIADLPTELVEAFKATLEEVVEADIILHVRDISHPFTKDQKKDVIGIMHNLVSDEKTSEDTIEILNKIDLLNNAEKNNLEIESNALTVSAKEGDGVDDLLQLIEQKLSKDFITTSLELDITDAKTLAWLYEHAQILNKEIDDNKIKVEIKISEENFSKLYDSI